MLLVRALGLSLLYAVLTFTPATRADEQPLSLAGLAVYTDTARDIYLAGLHRPATAVSPLEPSTPLAMEYRIETRRLSTRGYFGTLLLQAELGSGARAPAEVIDVIEQIKVRVQGSFLRGDSIEFKRGSDGDSYYSLNGALLLHVPGTETFDFFLQGWLGADASSLLREPLLAGSPDPALYARYAALTPSQARVDAVVSWDRLPDPDSQPASAGDGSTTAATEEASTPPPEPAPDPEPVPPPVPVADEPASERVASTAAAPESDPESDPESAPAVAPPGPDVASVVTPAPAANPQPSPEAPAAATAATVDDREYQRQLSAYMAQSIGRVFEQVEYPRRALKRGQQGQVTLVALVDDSGTLADVVLQTSSGHAVLDKAAIKAVQDAAPFPRLGAAAREEFAAPSGEHYELSIPVSFSMAASGRR